MKFKVLVREEVSKDVEVDASSYEEAVSKVSKMKIRKSVVMRPIFVDTAKYVDESGEYKHEVIGECDWCKDYLVDRERGDLPWLYGGNPKNEHGGLVCFKCLVKTGYFDKDGKRLKPDEWT